MATEKWVANARDVLLDVERIYDDHYFRANDQTVHDIFNAFRRIIRRHATFGFVEVVRCKDCKHYKNAEGHKPICQKYEGLYGYPKEDDFCSYGERRTDV